MKIKGGAPIYIWIIIFLPMFNGGNNNYAAIVVAVFLTDLFFVIKRNIFFYNRFGVILFVFALYFCTMLVILLVNYDGMSDFFRIMQFITCVLTLIFSVSYGWSIEDIWLIRKCIGIVLTVNFCMFVLSHFSEQFTGVYMQFNTLGVVCFLASVMLALPEDVYFLDGDRTGCKKSSIKFNNGLTVAGILVATVLIVGSSNRSSLIAMVIFFAVVLIAKKYEVGNVFYWMVFGIIVAIIIGFVYIYPSLYNTELGNQLNLLSRTYLHKNFFSGRQIIWKHILSAMKGRELFGYGLSMVPGKIYATTLSSHNLYLQTYLQGGIMGLMALVGILVTILKVFIDVCDKNIKPYFLAFLFAVCFHQCFEVSLIQNQLCIGLQIWVILGIMIRKSIYENSKKSVVLVAEGED